MERLLREVAAVATAPVAPAEPARRKTPAGTFRSPSEIGDEELLETLRANR